MISFTSPPSEVAILLVLFMFDNYFSAKSADFVKTLSCQMEMVIYPAFFCLTRYNV